MFYVPVRTFYAPVGGMVIFETFKVFKRTDNPCPCSQAPHYGRSRVGSYDTHKLSVYPSLSMVTSSRNCRTPIDDVVT